MTTQFNTTELTLNRFLVEGTDKLGNTGRIVRDGSQFKELKGDDSHSTAHAAFEEAVKEFYAPIVKAAEQLEAAHKAPDTDPFVEVLQPEVLPTAGWREVRVRLS